jgi:hypothetical protein
VNSFGTILAQTFFCPNVPSKSCERTTFPNQVFCYHSKSQLAITEPYRTHTIDVFITTSGGEFEILIAPNEEISVFALIQQSINIENIGEVRLQTN